MKTKPKIIGTSESRLQINKQWCNLTLTQRFWATKVCLWASKVSKICLSGCLTRQATY